MKQYLYEYEYGGSKWCFHLHAEDVDEARARLRLIAHAKYCGEVYATIPASCGWLVKAWCAVANFFRTK